MMIDLRFNVFIIIDVRIIRGILTIREADFKLNNEVCKYHIDLDSFNNNVLIYQEVGKITARYPNLLNLQLINKIGGKKLQNKLRNLKIIKLFLFFLSIFRLYSS